MASNFIVTVRRDNVLEGAIDQVRASPPSDLMRPLTVRIGLDEGESGHDLGGVQQEFFHLVFAQALSPDYAMFSVDEHTRMTWFKAGSRKPLYKFKVLGKLMSLAVYHSITLPVTFPLAFYRKLLRRKVKKLDHITDGWPDLAKGLQQMLHWSDGDVSQTFVRTYEFTYEAFGKQVNIDMKNPRQPYPRRPRERTKKMTAASFELPLDRQIEPLYSSTSFTQGGADDQATLVTNADREQYVEDYIICLTHESIKPQYKAFEEGFYTCLNRQSICEKYTPEALKKVVEGYIDIDISGLEAATQYEDGFNETSPTIQDFWRIVRNFDCDQHRQLLKFVTGSGRVPVNGIGSIQFTIERNGHGDDRLPTSMTCFSKLLLPQYSSSQALEKKLTIAIENSEGFGVA